MDRRRNTTVTGATNSGGSSSSSGSLIKKLKPTSFKAHPDLTILRGAGDPTPQPGLNQSAFLALQNTVRTCIPVVLPNCKVPQDLFVHPDPSLQATGAPSPTQHPLTRRQRVSSDENISASFRIKSVKFDKVTPEQIRRWEADFNFLLNDPDGISLFDKFLKSEFSQENLQFWEACEQYRRLPAKMLAAESQKIYQVYISVQSPREVNLDSKTRLKTISLLSTPTAHLFDNAQRKIQALMEKDSYQRFLRSPVFLNYKKSVLATPKQPTVESSRLRLARPRASDSTPSINSAFPSLLQVSTLPLGRKPIT